MSQPSPQIMSCCLLCGYDLQGLPNDHACPECGLPRGENAIVFREVKELRGWLGFAVRFVWILPGIAVGIRNNVALLAACVIAIPFSVVAYRHERDRKRDGGPVRAIVFQHGVALLDPPQSWRLHGWNTIGSVHRSFVDGAIVIKGRNGDTLDRRTRELLGGSKKAREFEALLRSRTILAAAKLETNERPSPSHS